MNKTVWVILSLVLGFMFPSCVNADGYNEYDTVTQDKSYTELDGVVYCDYANELSRYRSGMFKAFSKAYVENNTGIESDTAMYKVSQSGASGENETEKVRSLDGAHVLYKNEFFDLTGFSVWMYQTQYNENLFCNVYISDDGKNFRQLKSQYGDYKTEVNYITSANMYEIVFYSDYLKSGTKYLKVEFSKNCTTLDEVSLTQIGMAQIACTDTNELPPSAVEFTNNIYTDNCISVAKSEYAEYTGMRCESAGNETGKTRRRGAEKWLGRSGADVESYVTYKCPDANGQITDIALWLARHDAENASISVSVSEDGITFDEVGTIDAKNITLYPQLHSPQDLTGGWICCMGSMEYLPQNTKYLRLTLPKTYTNWWGLGILKVQLGYDSAKLKKQPNNIKTYQAPEKAPMSGAYTAKIRACGNSEWTDIDIYATKLRESGFIAGDDSTCRDSSFTYFDFEGAVEVAVTKTEGTVESFKITPSSCGVEYRQDRNTVYFILTEPSKLMVGPSDEDFDVLHIFANPMETEKPDITAENVIYFAPGYYDYENTGGILTALSTDTDYPYAELRVPSDTIVYIDGGAVVNAHITISGAENVTVCGRGILSGINMNTGDGKHVWPWQHWGIYITGSKNVTVRDIISNNADWYSIEGGSSSDITIDNFKALSNMEWADGIDMMSCSNVTINDCFLRNSDDCIAIYADRIGHKGNSENWTITNNILVADIARGINIGGHGSMDAGNRRIIQNIYCENNSIVSNRRYSEQRIHYAGTISVKVGDENIVKNVIFRDFDIEGAEEESVLSVRVMAADAANGGVPGFSAENILFENIRSDHRGGYPIEIYGWPENDGKVSGVTIKNLYLENELQHSFSEANVKFYSNAEDVYLIATDLDAGNVSVTYDVKNPVNRQPVFIAAEYGDNTLTAVDCLTPDNNGDAFYAEVRKVQRPFALYTFDEKTQFPMAHKEIIEK